MTDKEIEILYKSIDNFDEFRKSLSQRQDFKVGNKIQLKFNSITDDVDLCLPTRILTLDNLTLTRIINELCVEKTNQDNQELSRINNPTEERLRNEIFELGGNRYKVYKEYIENMYYASEIASLHGAYLNNLRELIRIFHRENILIIDQTQILSKEQLIDFLKAYGFNGLDRDLRLK